MTRPLNISDAAWLKALPSISTTLAGDVRTVLYELPRKKPHSNCSTIISFPMSMMAIPFIALLPLLFSHLQLR